jgi:DNA-binding NarL/FixJ family response regulator/signal transduction histidine kinase
MLRKPRERRVMVEHVMTATSGRQTSQEHNDSTRGEQPLTALAHLAAQPFSTLDELIDATLRLISDTTGAQLAMIHRLDGEVIVVTHMHDRIGLGVRPPVTVPRAATFCDRVLATLSPLIVLDADQEPYRHLPGKQLVGTKSYIGVPIVLAGGRVYGTLCAHDRRSLALGPEQVDLLLVLARIVASHLEREEVMQAQGQMASRLAARNADLADAVSKLKALQAITDHIAAQLDLRSLLETVVESAVRLLGAQGGAISLIGPSLDAPRRLTATYNLPESLRNEDIPAGAGLMGQVLAAQGPVIVSRYETLDHPLPHREFHELSPWVAVPIWWQGDIIGTFGIGAGDSGRAFNDRDVELLRLLAKHAAVAIENARLHATARELGAAAERNRLAADIHDTLAQSLLALIFQLRVAKGLARTSPDRAVAELAEAEERARAALEEARRSVWNLSPASLEAGSLVEALQGELAASARAGLPGRLVVTGSTHPLPPESQFALFRVAQEALANARKHAHASEAEIRLNYGLETVTLTVSDNGAGFEPTAVSHRLPRPDHGFGLAGMAQRVKRVGGTLHVISDPAERAGTDVIAAVPYAFPDAAVEPAESPARPTGRAIRVIVADDHPATRSGVIALLEAQPDIVVVGTAANGEEALGLTEALRPDILMIDLRMPKLGGVEAIARLGRLGLPTKAIAVTTFAQDELVLQAMRAGARGYLLKDASAEELATAVRIVHAGGTLLTPAIAQKVAEGLSARERLTPREREVLALLARGLPDKEIAAELRLSVKTANFHVANIIGKLGAQNRADAVRLAFERGLLADGS